VKKVLWVANAIGQRETEKNGGKNKQWYGQKKLESDKKSEYFPLEVGRA
jgi:hypothetical protein